MNSCLKKNLNASRPAILVLVEILINCISKSLSHSASWQHEKTMEMAIYHTGGVFSYLPPPPGSRARRLGWSQYMHECVGTSQGYHGVRVRVKVRVRVRVRVSWGSWWVLGVLPLICPTGVGIPLYPWQHLDRTVWAAR